MSNPWEPLDIVMGGYRLKPGRAVDIYVGDHTVKISVGKDGKPVAEVTETD